MQLGLLAFVLSTCLLSFAQLSELKTKFVRCAQDSKGNDIASAEMKTPIFTSKTGARIYGLVRAEFNADGCSNQTIVFIAEPHGQFQEVYRIGVAKDPQQQGAIYNGNGLARLDWSPNGKKGLAEIFQWTWGSDFGENNRYLVFAPDSLKPREIFPEKAIRKRFKGECGVLINSGGWLDNDTIRMTAKPWNDVENGTPSCIKRRTSFAFNISSGSVRPGAR